MLALTLASLAAAIALGGGAAERVTNLSVALANTTGVAAIERLRAALGAPVPAFLISGDTSPDRLREASANGYHLVHKPVPAMALRAALHRLLKPHDLGRRTPPAGP